MSKGILLSLDQEWIKCATIRNSSIYSCLHAVHLSVFVSRILYRFIFKSEDFFSLIYCVVSSLDRREKKKKNKVIRKPGICNEINSLQSI